MLRHNILSRIHAQPIRITVNLAMPTYHASNSIQRWLIVYGYLQGSGNVHGGTILKLCELAGMHCAVKHARKPMLTACMDRMDFLAPVHIGEVAIVTAECTFVSKHSVEVMTHVVAENVFKGEKRHTNTSYFVYVAKNEAVCGDCNEVWLT